MVKIKLHGFTSSSARFNCPPEDDALPDTPHIPMFRAETEAQAESKRILIVDDDKVFLKATAMQLESAGFQVVTATESSQAIAKLGEKQTDAVLMDINFPPDVCNGGMGSWDGFQIMYWMRGLPSATNTRFIVVSASDSPGYRKQAEELGAIAFFPKPLDHEMLVEVLNSGD